jgi:hypothetical protein
MIWLQGLLRKKKKVNCEEQNRKWACVGIRGNAVNYSYIFLCVTKSKAKHTMKNKKQNKTKQNNIKNITRQNKTKNKSKQQRTK